MEIHFHGAAQTVTGSQHLLAVNGSRILLDCGLYQGKRSEAYQRNKTFPYDPAELDAVVLSHAHTDHAGNLPNLVKSGFHKAIHATSPTCHLSRIMLQDSGKIQEYDVAFVNKKNARRGLPPVEPLYTQEDALAATVYFVEQPEARPFEVAPGVQATFYEAGHILGSAGVVLDIEERGRKFRLAFSGDIGRRELKLLRDPVFPSEVDALIMECTYGDKVHKPPQAAYDELREVVKRAVALNGKIIIPSFAVGRTQELVFSLHQMIEHGEIPPIPVFVDSPLAVNVTDVFRDHRECFDEETQEFIRHDRHGSALGFDMLTYIRSVDESKALNYRKEPMIIISASGMCEAGRVLHHLRNNIEDPRNSVLIVSWQAPYTLGRRIADRGPVVMIFGEEFELRAQVCTIGGFSAHAGQDLLTEYAASMEPRLQRVFLVHGEPRPAAALTEKLAGAGVRNIFYPAMHQAV
ncbi:MAG: MBL fold metallo-hydrolase, partial [Chloroflexi bacterium]|nr:MBL fold metallo-hydrolase [Chloroflexota bacterium]